MSFFVLGLNHKMASIDLREKFAFDTQTQSNLMSSVSQDFPNVEMAILCTCNRFEIYAYSTDYELIKKRLIDAIAKCVSVSESTLNSLLYFYVQETAVEHAFMVVSGLDSMILGEPQITGQFKTAFAQADAQGLLSRQLHKLSQRSLFVAKRVRNETDIGKHPVSIAYAATVLAKQIFGDLSSLSVMLIGAGKIGEATLKHFVGIKQCYIANRTEQKALDLALKYQGKSIPFDSFSKWLGDVEVVICALDGIRNVIDLAMVEHALQQRQGKALFFIDLAVPRNIDLAINDLDNAYLYNVDDLGYMTANNLGKREAAAAQARQVIEQEVKVFLSDMRALDVAPLIANMQQKFEQIRAAEIDKLLNKAESLAQREMVEQFSRSLLNKILHEPMVMIKEHADDQDVLGVIRKLFNC